MCTSPPNNTSIMSGIFHPICRRVCSFHLGLTSHLRNQNQSGRKIIFNLAGLLKKNSVLETELEVKRPLKIGFAARKVGVIPLSLPHRHTIHTWLSPWDNLAANLAIKHDYTINI